MSADEEKAEVFNAFLASVLNAKTSHPQAIQLPKLEARDREMSEGPIFQWKMPGPASLWVQMGFT